MRSSGKRLAVVLAVSVLFAGCGMVNASEFVKDQYQLENVTGSGATMQKVYRAQNASVSEVASKIASESKPDEMSAKSDERMFLVYPDHVIQVQQDPNKKEDALVEVDTKQFVRDHYDPGFLQGFLAASLISNLFGSNWRSYSGRGYSGYGDYRHQNPGGKYGGGGYRTPSGGYGGGYKAPAPSPGRGSVTPPRSGRGSGRVIKR